MCDTVFEVGEGLLDVLSLVASDFVAGSSSSVEVVVGAGLGVGLGVDLGVVVGLSLVDVVVGFGLCVVVLGSGLEFPLEPNDHEPERTPTDVGAKNSNKLSDRSRALVGHPGHCSYY
jgi:hypothetical protein